MNYEYIEIHRQEIPGRKTPIYHVINKKAQVPLAQIKWHGAWRQYCLFVDSDTIWSEGCLDDLKDALRQIKGK